MKFDSLVDKLNGSLSIIFVLLYAFLPFLILILMWKNFASLGTDEAKRKYGELYQNLDLRKGPHVTLVPFIFLMRRFLLGIVVVFQSHLIFQLLVLQISSFISLIFIEYFPSYKSVVA